MKINVHTHICPKEAIFAIYNIVLGNEEPLPDIDKLKAYSIGWHPWYLEVGEDREKEVMIWDIIEKYLTHPSVIAIGECGLDRAIHTDFKQQTDVFKKHILLSEKYKKPLIIHCVKAYNDLIAIKKQTKAQQTWIVHDYTGNLETALQLIQHHIFLSFGEALIYKEKTQKAFRQIPLEYIFFETDNSPVSIETIYEQGVLLKNIPTDVLKQQVLDNFVKVFKYSPLV